MKVLTMETLCGQIGNIRKKKTKRMWTHNTFLSRCNKDGFHSISNTVQSISLYGPRPQPGLRAWLGHDSTKNNWVWAGFK
jgi:hypothetical protein